MSLGRHSPRDDQIAELTRGIQLPLEPLHDFHIKFIAEMLAQAWQELQLSQKSTLETGGETEINALMETRLNALINEDRALSNLVHNVVRGKETVSFDATHLEKRPDLSIHLTDGNRNFPLVIECKIIEHSSGKTVGLYCNKGLVKFVRGEYAWATREAFLLAYVRDGSSINTSLTSWLRKCQKAKLDPYCTETLPVPANHPVLDLARSGHCRAFKYIGGSANNDPGSISLWHLWVSVEG